MAVEHPQVSGGDQLPPPENAGNFADITAQNYLGEIMFNYNDNYFASAPVVSLLIRIIMQCMTWPETFQNGYMIITEPSARLGGNRPIRSKIGTVPHHPGIQLGPWPVTEMRLSFRDFGEEPRDDVGFRVARYLE
ncbi:MAG: hypothetical protein CM1200mP40_31030 [Gammaproteobacteria bacterium]|nr:MAG: hypothetical protein CM1200mP40_31030 [Gammaproteobacteria bacterium]